MGFAPTAQAAPSASVQRAALQKAALARIKALLPADAARRVAALRQETDVIDPTLYECGPTELDAWVQEQVASFSTVDRLVIQFTALDAYPTYDAMMFGDAADPFYAAPDAAVAGAFTGARAFWTPALPATQLLGMRSEMVRDAAKVARIGGLVFGFDAATAQLYGRLVTAYVRLSPGLQQGRHPILSFGAFASGDPGDDSANRIIIGHGLLVGYDDLGYADVAGPFITAHEVGHTVQLAAGLYDAYTGEPEETRYLELMADATAAYYSAHPAGLDLREQRVEQFVAVARTVGDCAFDSGGHHGTPNQRARAAQWAATVSDAARPAGRVLTFAEFRYAFDAAYPNLIAPDAAPADA
ncbi:hypothetical protein [Propioniciclava soli]|uniref:hypothetical protein n=1 Tax=Propioniciclava soli TaxID=2775081 RepID=UPI001E559554|nr:hypothetical protein [Propioniciclava soli]